MNIDRLTIIAALLLAGLLMHPQAARAAQSYDACAGHYIDTLPATIATQGTWCLRHDLSTAITSGAAITIATNNVTIDCDDFKIGGLAAGVGTNTTGIAASSRLNILIRHCTVRGFLFGTALTGIDGGGHVVEDNRFDGNTSIGIDVAGDGSVVRRNLVRDTGGSTGNLGFAYGIYAVGTIDVRDNTVDGVAPVVDGNGNADSYGIYEINSDGGRFIGNGIRGLVSVGTGEIIGIRADGGGGRKGRVFLRGNDIVGSDRTPPHARALYCSGELRGRAVDNILLGNFAPYFAGCSDDGNVYYPIYNP